MITSRGKLSDLEFDTMLELLMVSDLWPLLHDGGLGHAALSVLLDREAMARGHRNWISAYHARLQ